LFKEAFLLKKYKAMNPVLPVLVGILMIPFALLTLVGAIFLYSISYIFKIAVLPIEQLHSLLHEEGQSVMHATQFVIYLLSWVFIFWAYTMFCFLSVITTILYSFCSVTTYVWTLGGIKFHLFPNQDDISVSVEGTYNILLPVIMLAGVVVLMLIVPVFQTIAMLFEYEFVKLEFEMILNLLKMKIVSMQGITNLFTLLYTVIVLAPRPKKISE
jgi:hypothetical protein